MLRSSENALDALEHHLRANGVLSMVQRRIEVGVLFRHDQDGFECLCRAVLVGRGNGHLNVRPYIGGVVSVQVDYLLQLELCLLVVFVLVAIAVEGDCV
jgi:hypothetical protein